MLIKKNQIEIKCLNCGHYFCIEKKINYINKINFYSLDKLECPECNKIGKCVISRKGKLPSMVMK